MRYDLNVKYEDKDKVKTLGARWDLSKKVWYVVDPKNLGVFDQWKPSAKTWDKYRQRPLIHTGVKVFKPLCNCNVEPWEDCEHTEELAHKAFLEMSTQTVT